MQVNSFLNDEWEYYGYTGLNSDECGFLSKNEPEFDNIRDTFTHTKSKLFSENSKFHSESKSGNLP